MVVANFEDLRIRVRASLNTGLTEFSTERRNTHAANAVSVGALERTRRHGHGIRMAQEPYAGIERPVATDEQLDKRLDDLKRRIDATCESLAKIDTVTINGIVYGRSPAEQCEAEYAKRVAKLAAVLSALPF